MADNTRRLTKRSIQAGSLLTLYRGVAKLGGLFKTAITARILNPNQFGMFGFVSITLNLFETFSEMGIEHALIQDKNITDRKLQSGWFVINIRSLIIVGILLVSAPVVAWFFQAPDLRMYIWVISVTPLLRSLRNPNLIINKRQLKFGQETAMLFSGTLVEIISAIILAVMTQSVWALVISIILGALTELVVSYIVLPLPRWQKIDMEYIPGLLRFGKWVWSASTLSYLVNQGDDIIVGKLLGTAPLGFYQNAFKLASLPATEITGTITQVSFPAMAAIQHQKDRLKRAFRKTLIVNSLLTLPIALILVIWAQPIVLIIYGDQWMPVIPILKVLALFGAIRSFNTNFESFLVAQGRPDIPTKAGLIRLGVLLILIGPFILWLGIVGAAISTLVAICSAGIYLSMAAINLISQASPIPTDARMAS